MRKELICISCPLGCNLVVEYQDQNNVLVKGNTCKRGETYARNELFSPKRMVTSSVVVVNGEIARLSVKTKDSIPKSQIFSVLEEIKKITLTAPVFAGEVIIQNVCNLGVDIIATKNVEAI